MKKITKLFFVTVLSVFLCVGVVACKPTDSQKNDDNYDYYIEFDASEVSINMGETFVLEVDTDKENATIAWSSSNTDIVTVSTTGEIYGVGVGSSTITAKLDDKTFATCTVVVNDFTFSTSISEKELCLQIGDDFYLSATALVNGKTEDDANIVWKTENKGVVSVENGRVTSLKVGAEKVFAEITCMGKTETQICDVTCVKPYSFELSEYNVYLSSKSGGTYATTETITYNLSIDSVEITSGVTFKSLDETVATVDQNGVIKAVDGGETIIAVEYTSNDGFVNIAYANVFVEKVYAKQNVEGKVFALIGSEVNIYGEYANVQKVAINGEEKDFTHFETKNLLLNEETFTNCGHYKVYAYDDETEYAISVVIATKFIASKEDWNTLGEALNADSNGYIVLRRDIDLDGETYDTPLIENWYGTIDGCGHIVKNLTVSVNLKGWLANNFGGTIKDIAFVDFAAINTNWSFALFGTMTESAKAENVIITGEQKLNKQYNNLLAYRMNGTVKDCVIMDKSQTQLGTHTSGHGGAALGIYNEDATYENTILIADGMAFIEQDVNKVWVASTKTHAGIAKMAHSDGKGQDAALKALNGKGYITYFNGELMFNNTSIYIVDGALETVKQPDAEPLFFKKGSASYVDVSAYENIWRIKGKSGALTANEEGKILLSDIGTECGRYNVTVIYETNKEVNIPVVIADYLIENKEDWDNLGNIMTANGTEYIVLVNNIDLSGTIYGSIVTGGWKGTMDGYGHIVSNASLRVGMGGWFCTGYFYGTMKDIAFSNLTALGTMDNPKDKTYALFAGVASAGVIENVVVIGQSSGNGQYNNLFSQAMGGTVKNCLVVDNSATQLGTLEGAVNGHYGSVLGTYVTPKSYDNMIVIADGAAFTEKADGTHWTPTDKTRDGIMKVTHSDKAGQSTVLSTLDGIGWFSYDATRKVLSFNGMALYTIAD